MSKCWKPKASALPSQVWAAKHSAPQAETSLQSRSLSACVFSAEGLWATATAALIPVDSLMHNR